MPIRIDNKGKRKALICEESNPETRSAAPFPHVASFHFERGIERNQRTASSAFAICIMLNNKLKDIAIGRTG